MEGKYGREQQQGDQLVWPPKEAHVSPASVAPKAEYLCISLGDWHRAESALACRIRVFNLHHRLLSPSTKLGMAHKQTKIKTCYHFV